jgi:hypothetical protein
MIRSFKDKETERIFSREGSRKFPTDIQRPALRKLLVLHGATNVNDLKVPPGNIPALQHAFGTVALDARDWLRCVTVASSVLWIREATKFITRATRQTTSSR